MRTEKRLPLILSGDFDSLSLSNCAHVRRMKKIVGTISVIVRDPITLNGHATLTYQISFKWFILTNRSGRDFLLVPTLSTALRQLRLLSGRHFRFCSKPVNFPSLNHESTFTIAFMMILVVLCSPADLIPGLFLRRKATVVIMDRALLHSLTNRMSR